MTYQSESDFPIKKIFWQVKQGTTIDGAARTLGKTNYKTDILPPAAFSLSQSDQEIQRAVSNLQKTTKYLTLYKTPRGDCNFDLLLIGMASPTQVVGLRTTSVES